MINLKYIAFEITDSCNLDCVYCYNIWKTDKVKRVPFNSYSKAIKTLEKLFSITEIDYITFTGGEPFLAERFNEVVLYCIMAGKKVSIISNGTQANQQKYKELIKLGVELFELPIHSSQPEIHNKMVQLNGSWEKSIASIKTVQELGGKVVPVIVITKHNVNQIAETLDFIASMGCNRIMLNRYNIGGKGCENPLKVSATAEELRHAFYIANEKANELNLKITANVCTPICLLNPSDYPSIGFGHCSFNVLERPITLDINGNIRLCNHSPIVAGNIYETELSKILYSEYTTEWETSIPEFCKPCSQWLTCKGGCRAATEQCIGRLDIEDPIIKALNINSIFKENNEDTYEIVWQKGFCGFKNSKGEMITPYKYDYAKSYTDGLAQVMLVGKYGFIDRQGIEIIPIQYDNVDFFSEGLAPVKLNGKWRFIDKQGNEVIPIQYDCAWSFSEGLAVVILNDEWGFINKLGIKVIPLRYAAWSFSEGLARVMLNDKNGFIDKQGNEVIPIKYHGAESFYEGLALVQLNGKHGFIDKQGNETIPIKYDYALSFSEKLALVQLNGKWGFIDKQGNEVIPFQFAGAGSFIEGLALVQLNGKDGFIDKQGNEVIPIQYDYAWSFSEGLAPVKLNSKWGFIDKQGNEVIPIQYENVGFFSEGLAPVKLNGIWGFIDNQGNEIIPFQYNNAKSFREGLAQVILNEKSRFIDKRGNWEQYG